MVTKFSVCEAHTPGRPGTASCHLLWKMGCLTSLEVKIPFRGHVPYLLLSAAGIWPP